MAVLLSTKLNLPDVTSRIQAGLKSTVSAVKRISLYQPHPQEVIVQRSRIPYMPSVLFCILYENSEKLPDVELLH